MDIPTNWWVLLGAILLGAGGAGLLTAASRLNRDALLRRLELVRPAASYTPESRGSYRAAQTPNLVRSDSEGVLGRQQREAMRRLAGFDLPSRYATAIYGALPALCATLLAGIGGFLCVQLSHTGSRLFPVAVTVALFLLGWFLPRVIFRWMVKRRARAAAQGLPDALELLVVCIEAGLSLENAIDRIIPELEISQPALAAELALTSADLKILPSRDEALAQLAERIDVPSVRSVVATLTQTLRYGTPLAHALRVVAADMRTASLIDLEERANRLPAIMTVPMMLFIMPVIFLIVGGPAVLRLLDVMGQR